MLSELKLFLGKFRRNFHTTGALFPSSPLLAQAILKSLKKRKSGPVRVLEVGPGTGSFTFSILKHLRPGDTLHIYEIDAQFHHYLARKLHLRRAQWPGIAIELYHQDILTLAGQQPYDFIISGLPFANFDAEKVGKIMELYLGHLSPQGVLTYFEYLLPHQLRLCWMKPHQREAFKRLRTCLRDYTQRHQTRAEHVWLNFPPARTRCLEHSKESCLSLTRTGVCEADPSLV